MSQRKSRQEAVAHDSREERQGEGPAPAEFMAHDNDIGFLFHTILGGQWWSEDDQICILKEHCGSNMENGLERRKS